jgi:hypothetical protein
VYYRNLIKSLKLKSTDKEKYSYDGTSSHEFVIPWDDLDLMAITMGHKRFNELLEECKPKLKSNINVGKIIIYGTSVDKQYYF